MQKKDSSLATTSPIEPNAYANLTEAEFLTHEAQLARSAMSSTIDEMKGSLKNAADLTLWTHHHPWMSVGVAAAGGFTLASMFKGTTSDGLKSMMGGSAAVNANSESSVAAAENGQTKSLMGSLFNLARTALEATLVSAIRAEGISRAAQPQPPEPQPLAPSQTPKAQYSQSTYSEPLQHSVAH